MDSYERTGMCVCALKDLYEALGCVVYFANAEHLTVVAVELSDVARHVNIEDVALLELPACHIS